MSSPVEIPTDSSPLIVFDKNDDCPLLPDVNKDMNSNGQDECWGDSKEEEMVEDQTNSNEEEDHTLVSWLQTVKNTMMVGRVKWFNDKLGYGFITVVKDPQNSYNMNGQADVFVHHTGVRPSMSEHRMLIEGEYVWFSVAEGPHGMQAVNVTGVFGGPLMCDVLAENNNKNKDDEYVDKNMKYDKNMRFQMNRARRSLMNGNRVRMDKVSIPPPPPRPSCPPPR